MSSPYRQIGQPIPDLDIMWVAALAQRLGPPAAARRIGVSRATFASILAGLPVAAMTAERVRAARIGTPHKAA